MGANDTPEILRRLFRVSIDTDLAATKGSRMNSYSIPLKYCREGGIWGGGMEKAQINKHTLGFYLEA